MIGKHKIERICRAAGMKPVTREKIDGVEIFIADGFSLMPHRHYRRFGVEPHEFPQGMYVTLWWASKGDEKLDIGQPLFFDVMRNPEYANGSKQRARINAALKTAREFLTLRRRRTMH